MIVVDTSGLLAALFPDQRFHGECARVLEEAPGPFLISPFVLAETDYLISRLAGAEEQLALLEEMRRGAYELAAFDAADLGEAISVLEAHPDLEVGLADASLVVLARRWQTNDLLTLDQRHFRTLTGFRDRPFRILPFDDGLS